MTTFARHYNGKHNPRPSLNVDPALKAAYADRRQPITRPNQPAAASPAAMEAYWLDQLFRRDPAEQDAICRQIDHYAALQGKPTGFGTPEYGTTVTVHKPTGSKEVDPDADEDDIPFGKWEWARNPPPYNDERDDEPHRVRPEQQ